MVGDSKGCDRQINPIYLPAPDPATKDTHNTTQMPYIVLVWWIKCDSIASTLHQTWSVHIAHIATFSMIQ